MGLGNIELVEQRGNVVAHGLERKRAVGVRRAAVALQFDRDHLMGLREGLEQRGHFADRHQSAVQQDERSTLSVDLMIELDAVHLGIAGGDWCERRSGPFFRGGLRHGWLFPRSGWGQQNEQRSCQHAQFSTV